MNRKLAFAPARTPLEYPRGAPSDSGLIKVKLIWLEQSLTDYRRDRVRRIATSPRSVARREMSQHLPVETSFQLRPNPKHGSRRDANSKGRALHLRLTGAVDSRRFVTMLRSGAQPRVSAPASARPLRHRKAWSLAGAPASPARRAVGGWQRVTGVTQLG